MNNATGIEPVEEAGIAIVGMALRLPGADSIEQFWENLCRGDESITFFTDEELKKSGVGDAELKNPAYVKANAILSDIEMFDASFFGLSPREAEIIDPQHRLFLECAWEALDNAGYDAKTFDGRIGVYAGAGFNTYLFNLFSNPEYVASVGYFQTMMGNSSDHLTSLVSYKLNLKGPSVTVQTACSTSLVATHFACQSLLSGESDMALAGGASLTIPQKIGYLFQEEGIVSPDGHCRAFDAQARGTVGASGVATVLLKRLSDALVEGDHIYAVIRGSAINNDGSLKIGYTAPSLEGQAEVIAEAMAMAQVDAKQISYVETHGTATPLGDPVEIAALAQAYRADAAKTQYCAIGSVKTNIGHTDTAAGVAGLIKAALVLNHRQIPPSLHFERPNPQIDFANSPFYVNTSLRVLPPRDEPYRASVSSFGLGGTNAHAVLEESPVTPSSPSTRALHLLTLSAKTLSALDSATARLANHIRHHPEQSIADVAHTLMIGRSAFGHRRTLVCHDREDALQPLESLDPRRVFSGFQEAADRPVVFLFPGGGAQYVEMGRGLYDSETVFREHIDRCAELLRSELDLDIRDALYPTEERREKAAVQLHSPLLALPALFAVEYSLARLLMAYGLRPHAMIGHSLGEYVASCLSGVISLEEVLPLLAFRSRLMQRLPEGAMTSVPLSEEELQPLLGEDLSIAALNGPSMSVVSGSPEAIAKIEETLVGQGFDVSRLHLSLAAHSHLVEPIMEELSDFVRKLNLRAPTIPYLSNVTGRWITTAEATDPLYWVQHLRQPVRFSDGVMELLKDTDSILLEVGPGRMVSTLVRQHADKVPGQLVLSSLRHPHDQDSDAEVLMNALGRLWLSGAHLNPLHFYNGEKRRRVPLPGYPFERQRYWVEPRRQRAEGSTSQASLRKKADIAGWFYIPSWKESLAPRLLTDGELAAEPQNWLLFADGSQVGATLAERLRGEGQTVDLVTIADEFVDAGEGLYSINPRQAQHYEQLIQMLTAQDRSPQQVVHLWGLSEDEDALPGAELFKTCQERGYYSLLYLAQAMAKNELAHEIRLTVVGNGIQDFYGEPIWRAEKATVLGPCMVIPQEYLNVTCESVDVVNPSQPAEVTKLIELILAETKYQSHDLSVVYRGARRFVRSYEAVRLEGDADPVRQLRHKGVYLITGGRGHVGLQVAEHLARTKQARLALLGRSDFPARDEWEEWLAVHAESEGVSRTIRRIQKLEQLGAEVLLLTADVADEEQMRGALRQVDERFGELHGVLHAAGITSGDSIFRPIVAIHYEQSELQYGPKVYGLYVLERLLRGRDPDFCLLFSSNASVLGGMGFVAYAAANLFMDAFATRHAGVGRTAWLSATWDGWGAEAESVKSVQTSMDELNMTTEESSEAFQRVISQSTVGHVVVSTADLASRLGIYINRGFLKSQKQGQGIDAVHLRPALANAYVPPSTEAERKIVTIWQDLLGIGEVGVHDNFFELGGHSLLATQVIARLREAFDVLLTLRSLFEKPTVAELALMIEHLVVAELDAVSEDEAQRLLAASTD